MRIAPAMLALIASVFVAGFAAPVQPVSARADGLQCTDWTSTNEPPETIAVYRVSEGFVERVNFKHYVARVVSREWNVKQVELRKAGAVAVKQYAWYHILHWRGGKYDGNCFDVRDSTADQLYSGKPIDEIPNTVWSAVNETWSWRLQRGDKFPMTGYRRGDDVPCAQDAGYKLRVRSAKKCAEKGWSAGRLLRVYYTATLEK